MTAPIPALAFPYRDIAVRIALSSGIGLLVGLEREWSQKEIGTRTFAITGLLGMLTSILAAQYVVGALVGVFIMIGFLNAQSMFRDRSLELTTSICLIVVFFLGVLVGTGHDFTAASSAIVMMMLLAWKLELERFADALKPEEIRSAILLAMLSVVVYPLLKDEYVDPYQLINPQKAWTIVIVIAGIGFVNYALLRLYRTRGLYFAAVLGGLVNSTAAVSELSATFKGRPDLAPVALAVLLLTNVAMFVRNLVILQIFAPSAVTAAAVPIGVMALLTLGLVWLRGPTGDVAGELKLASPVSLKRVLKFGALFLLLSSAGTLAQREFGNYGFLAVAALGGLVSSASTAATAATLATAGQISYQTAALATVITSISSALVNMPLVYQQTRQPRLTRRLAAASVGVTAAGLLAMLAVVELRP